MEGGGRKQSAPSSSSASTGSSISNELFGPKGSTTKPNSSTGIFDSVFSQPSKYSRSEVTGSWKNKDSENQGWNSKQETSGKSSQVGESQGSNAYNRGRNNIFQDNKVEPHYLSSSLYYGGQDVYSNPSDARSSVSPHTYKKDDEDDDPHGSASRGNWWQGGLYY